MTLLLLPTAYLAAVSGADWSGLLNPLFDLVPHLVAALLGVLVLVLIWLVRAGLRLLHFRLLRDCARQLVHWAAQKLPEDLSGSAKFRRVMARLKKAFPRVPQEQLETAIEEAVLELKAGLAQM